MTNEDVNKDGMHDWGKKLVNETLRIEKYCYLFIFNDLYPSTKIVSHFKQLELSQSSDETLLKWAKIQKMGMFFSSIRFSKQNISEFFWLIGVAKYSIYVFILFIESKADLRLLYKVRTCCCKKNCFHTWKSTPEIGHCWSAEHLKVHLIHDKIIVKRTNFFLVRHRRFRSDRIPRVLQHDGSKGFDTL